MEKIYAGSGKTRSGNYGEFYSISVCLDDLPDEHITTAKNGKRYVNLTINKKRETDQYGKDLSVQVDTWRPDGAKQSYNSNVGNTPSQGASIEDTGYDLPF